MNGEVSPSFDRVITRALISIGEHLDLRVVAEGVETERQLELLQALGCRYAQGWLCDQPTAAEKILSACQSPMDSSKDARQESL